MYNVTILPDRCIAAELWRGGTETLVNTGLSLSVVSHVRRSVEYRAPDTEVLLCLQVPCYERPRRALVNGIVGTTQGLQRKRRNQRITHPGPGIPDYLIVRLSGDRRVGDVPPFKLHLLNGELPYERYWRGPCRGVWLPYSVWSVWPSSSD